LVISVPLLNRGEWQEERLIPPHTMDE